MYMVAMAEEVCFPSLPTLEQFGAECDVTRLKIGALKGSNPPHGST